MNKKFYIFIVLIGFSLASLFVFYALMKSRKTEITNSHKIYSRVIKNTQYKSVKEFNNTEDFKSIFIHGDTILALDETGTVFILDFELNQIKKVTESGTLKNRILDILILQNGEYLVLDGTLGIVFSQTSGTTIKIYQAPFQIIRGEFIDEKHVLVKASLPNNPETVHFMKIFLTSGKIEILKVDEPNVEYPDMTLDGFLVSGRNNILHVCYKTGLFSCFSDAGEFQYTTTTLDQSPPPTILVSKSGTKRYNPYSSTVNIHATSDSETIYILSNNRTLSDIGIKNIIDCYNIKNGNYIYSFTFEDVMQLSGILKAHDNIVGLRGNQILLFKPNE